MPRAARTLPALLLALVVTVPLAACGDDPKKPTPTPTDTATASEGPTTVGTEEEVKPVGHVIDAGICYVALKGSPKIDELPELLLNLGFRGEKDRAAAEKTVKEMMPTENYNPLGVLEQFAYMSLPDESKKQDYARMVEVAATAVAAIGMLGDKAAVAKLTPLLTAEMTNVEIKIAAVYSLGELGATEAVSVIADQLKRTGDKANSRLRINALRALHTLDARGEIETCAAALRSNAVPDEIHEVCTMVREWGVNSVNRHLIPLLDYPEQGSRDDVAATLEPIITASDRAALERVVRNGQAGLQAARNLLGKIGN